MPTRFAFAGVLLAALALAAPPVAAQSLLDDILPDRGTCTCAVMEPPNNCEAILAEPRSIARQQRGEIRAQCARDWRAGCEEQYGWQACSSAEANQQLSAQCDTLSERWWTEIAAPQINDISRQCNSANASWIQQCETVERPQNCRTCEDMGGEIAALERDIADARAWLEAMRSGETLLTPQVEEDIAQRVDEVDRWERDLAEKRDGYSLLQDSEYCPRA
jgi:hypothetical protein